MNRITQKAANVSKAAGNAQKPFRRNQTQTQPAPLKLKIKPTMHLTPTFIQNDVIGNSKRFQGPFGERTITYADYTASGKGLASVENFMRNVVMPMYANTHTEVSATGLQTTVLREEARRAVMDSCNAHPDHDALIFVGSGATGAIHRITTILGLKPRALRERWNEHGNYADPPPEIPECLDPDRPLVIVGPSEHHSNELVWRELNVDLYVLDEDHEGRPDLEQMKTILEENEDRSLKIGSFCAGSNVTGILPDCDELARVMHQHGGLAFFDYAGSGPYVDIDMNPADDPEARKDAIFLSPHKFVGGPGSSGVLLVKRSLCTNPVPSIPGGGTVAFVTHDQHRYDPQIEHREEGGTPGIPQCIRAGLAFKVKDAVGPKIIEERESKLVHQALQRWKAHPHVKLIGDDRAGYWDEHRLSIVSFNVHTDQAGAPGRRLHCHFVSQVLNDLFGLQSRSGCSCAGPYGLRLMGVTPEIATGLSALIERTSIDSLKYGWARVNFNYFISDEEAEFIIRAVEMVADHGWKLLPYYSMDTKTGQWRHREYGNVMADTMAHLDIPTLLSAQHASPIQSSSPGADRQSYLREAERVFARAHEAWLRGEQEPQDFTAGSEWPAEAAKYQSFVLPSELEKSASI